MSGELFGNVLRFGRILRGVGLHAPPSRLADFARALEYISIGRRRDFFHAARSLFVRRREEMALFDEAFEVFWRKPAEGATNLDLRAMGERRRFKRPRFDPAAVPDGSDESARGGERREDGRPLSAGLVRTWSAREVLRHKDFGQMTAAETEEVKELLAREAILRVRERRTRRLARSRRGLPDLRRTLRRSLVHGGEFLTWDRQSPRTRPRRLVVLGDVSGSMEPYTRMLLLFLYGLAAPERRRVEVFLFATRLTRVTRELGAGNPEHALAAVSRAVPDWSGGTRIGEAIRNFNFVWSRRVLRSGDIVLVVSDGWDRGEPDLLAREMARLQRSCHRLLWLNPLLASPRYEPLARGMRTARPYVDDFLPAHNVASLGQLARRLEELPAERPARRQAPAHRTGSWDHNVPGSLPGL
jgi:uncharacterized protein with von Willebrand factor type A (vWA) domain